MFSSVSEILLVEGIIFSASAFPQYLIIAILAYDLTFTDFERVANQHYPEQARLQNITGDVRLMVIINEDGTVKAIRLLESSGSTILDEAAKQSVRQSAPYGRFDAEMKDIVELRVIRTWRYANTLEVMYWACAFSEYLIANLGSFWLAIW